MKISLDINDISNDFFSDTRVFGIVAPVKNYFFCWQLNNILGVKFTLNIDAEVEILRKKRKHYFNVYHWQEPDTYLTHYLYHTHCNGEYLLPEVKHIDFIWLMKGDCVEHEKFEWIKKNIYNISGVQLVTDINMAAIKSRENLLF